jgi:tetratricopeptide (TPR) repeat protein
MDSPSTPRLGWILALALAGAGWAACGPDSQDHGPRPGSGLALLEQAQQAYQAGLTEGSRQLCTEALDQDPGLARAHLLLGLNRRLEAERQPDPQTTQLEIEAFSRAVELAPDALAARVNLASSLIAAGRQQQAALHLRQAAKLAADKPWAEDLLALAAKTDPAAQPAGEQNAAPDRPEEP